MTEYGVIAFSFGVTIEHVIKGDAALTGQDLRVSSGRYIWAGRDSMWPPHLAPENRVVLFMKRPRLSDEPNVRYPWTLVSAEEGLQEVDDQLLDRLRVLCDEIQTGSQGAGHRQPRSPSPTS